MPNPAPDWDNERCLELIDAYANATALWDPKNASYFSKADKQAAWQKVARTMKSDVEDIKKKMTSLMASFRREKLKTMKSVKMIRGRGVKYIPKWFAYERMQFLIDRHEPFSSQLNSFMNDIDDTEVPTNVVKIAPLEAETMGVVRKEFRDPEEQPELRESREREQREFSFGESPRIDANKSDFRQDNNVSPTISKKRKKIRKDESRTNKAQLPTKSTVASNVAQATTGVTETTTATTTTTTSSTNDECTVYGQHVANKLRKYSSMTRALVEHAINDVLFQADIGRYECPYHVTYPSYQPQLGPNSSSNPPSCLPQRCNVGKFGHCTLPESIVPAHNLTQSGKLVPSRRSSGYSTPNMDLSPATSHFTPISSPDRSSDSGRSDLMGI